MFKWSDYLDTAERLYSSNDEASTRSAISRAYYSVYGEAREHLEEKGVKIPHGPGAHQKMWRNYSHEMNRDAQRLRKWRNKADYERPYRRGDISKNAEKSIEMARYMHRCLLE